MHKSVLLDESIEYLNLNDESNIVDCTLGYGGHAGTASTNRTEPSIFAVPQARPSRNPTTFTDSQINSMTISNSSIVVPPSFALSTGVPQSGGHTDFLCVYGLFLRFFQDAQSKQSLTSCHNSPSFRSWCRSLSIFYPTLCRE